jgi:hypothetical protein
LTALGAAVLSSGAGVSGLSVLVLLMCMAADSLGLVRLNLPLALKLVLGMVLAWRGLREPLGLLLLL